MTTLQAVYPISEVASLLDLYENNSYFKQTVFNDDTQSLETHLTDVTDLETHVGKFIAAFIRQACENNQSKVEKCILFFFECKILLPIYGALKEQLAVGNSDITEVDNTFELFLSNLPMASLITQAFKHSYFLEIFQSIKLASFKPTEDNNLGSELLPTFITVDNLGKSSLVFTLYSGNPKTEKDLEDQLLGKFKFIANFLDSVPVSEEEDLVVRGKRRIDDFCVTLHTLTAKYLESYKDG